MSEQRYLSRMSLRRDVPAAALREVLLPTGDDERVASAHRLIWTLFADQPDRVRDFLWREGRYGEFYVLSERPPDDRHGFFHIDTPRVFAPSLRVGDRLSFMLRVNATISRSSGPGQRGKPCDVVMDALHRVAADERAQSRKQMLVEVATKWMVGRSAKSGFAIGEELGRLQVDGYQVMRIGRKRGLAKLSIGVLDLQGELEVRDPALLVASIGRGFGRARAFGCGLMLIKRL